MTCWSLDGIGPASFKHIYCIAQNDCILRPTLFVSMVWLKVHVVIAKFRVLHSSEDVYRVRRVGGGIHGGFGRARYRGQHLRHRNSMAKEPTLPWQVKLSRGS